MVTAKPIISLPPKHVINNLHVTDDKKLIVTFNYEGMGQYNGSTDAIAAYDINGKKLWAITQPKHQATKSMPMVRSMTSTFRGSAMSSVPALPRKQKDRSSSRPTDSSLERCSTTPCWAPTFRLCSDRRPITPVARWHPLCHQRRQSGRAHFPTKGSQQEGRFEGAFRFTDSGVKLAAMVRATPKPIVVLWGCGWR